MSTFFRKVASAFVVLEDAPSSAPKSSLPPSPLDDITNDASSLLAQLDAPRARTTAPPAANVSRPSTAPKPAATAKVTAPPPSAGRPPSTLPPSPAAPTLTSHLKMNAEEVFASAGLTDGPDASPRILRMIAGLAMFPPEQQKVMIRAMDAADDSWSEPAVVADSRQRQAVLQHHLEAIESERVSQNNALQQKMLDARKQGQGILEDVDKQIQELQTLRQEAVNETATALANLESQSRNLETMATSARDGILSVINGLKALDAFFQSEMAPRPSPAARPGVKG